MIRWGGSREQRNSELQQIKEDGEKLRLALICMEGEAIHWFQYWKEETGESTWATLAEALLERFGDGAQGSVHEWLSAIKQRGSMGEYIHEFDVLLAQARGTPPHIMMGYFLAGLRKSIRDQVRIQDRKKLSKALTLARQVEESQRDPRNTVSTPSRFRDSRYRGNSVVTRSGSREDQSGSRRTTSDPVSNAKPNMNAASSTTNASNNSKFTGGKTQNRNMGTRFLPKAEHAR